MNSHQRDVNIWKGQLTHVVCLSALLVISWYGWHSIGEPFSMLFWIAVSVPVIHQVFVWLAWRLELKGSLISRMFGFQVFLFVFFALFLLRFISLAILGVADRGSLGISPEFGLLLTFICLVPGIYAMYSVKRYFGLKRAAGGDHFEVKYQTMNLANKGIFQFTSNGMYVYAFLLFWAIAFYFSSIAALIVAAFSHVYIWVHYYCTERPDMEYIYTDTSFVDKSAYEK